MSVPGIRNRVGLLEAVASTNTPNFRIVFVQPYEECEAILAAANLEDDESPIVVRFVNSSSNSRHGPH